MFPAKGSDFGIQIPDTGIIPAIFTLKEGRLNNDFNSLLRYFMNKILVVFDDPVNRNPQAKVIDSSHNEY